MKAESLIILHLQYHPQIVLKFIINSNLFVSLCATSLAWTTYKLHNIPVDAFILLIVFISTLFAWLFPFLMVAICAQVVLRGAGMNQAWLDDFQWWLYGSAVLVGIAYAVTTNSHVRVDILYDGFSLSEHLPSFM